MSNKNANNDIISDNDYDYGDFDEEDLLSANQDEPPQYPEITPWSSTSEKCVVSS